MKRIISFIMIFVIVLCNMTFAFAQGDFVITNDGEITEYYGGEWVVVPDVIDGIPVTKIGEGTFFDLGIADVYLPEGLAVIGASAFEGCNAVSVDIPSTLKIIGENAFANCGELSTVFIGFDENTVISEGAFSGTGFITFYINCDTDTTAIERNLVVAKGDLNFDVIIRHTQYDYDEVGNGMCFSCGFREVFETESLPFTDVPNDAWYYDYVKFAYDNKIINGKSEGIFDPDATMTCAEAAKIAASIHTIFYDEIPEYTEGPWYQPYVDYCYSTRLIEESVAFDWEKPITRAQMAYIFANCDPFEYFYEDINDVPMTDIPDVTGATPFAHQILTLYNKGVAVGDETMSFYPNDSIKRCEAAAIVARIMDYSQRIELPKG